MTRRFVVEADGGSRGNPGPAGAPSTSAGIGIEVWLPAKAAWNNRIHALGGGGWQARKAKLKQRIREMAGKLIQIAAARMLKEAPRLIPPHGVYDEFCARFPFAETEDQQRAPCGVHQVHDAAAVRHPYPEPPGRALG